MLSVEQDWVVTSSESINVGGETPPVENHCDRLSSKTLHTSLALCFSCWCWGSSLCERLCQHKDDDVSDLFERPADSPQASLTLASRSSLSLSSSSCLFFFKDSTSPKKRSWERTSLILSCRELSPCFQPVINFFPTHFTISTNSPLFIYLFFKKF